MSSHWAAQYIGRPYERGNQGPEAFDCFSLVRYVLKHHFGIEVPVISIPEGKPIEVIKAFIGHEEMSNWMLVPQQEAQEGDPVQLAHALYPRHIGIWICPGQRPGVLHALASNGVVFSSPDHLRSQRWGKLEYYRHVSRA